MSFSLFLCLFLSLGLFVFVSSFLSAGFLQLWEHVWPLCGAGWGVSTHRNSPACSSRGRAILHCGLCSFSRGSQQDCVPVAHNCHLLIKAPILAFPPSLSHFPTSWLLPETLFQMQYLHPTLSQGPRASAATWTQQPGSKACIPGFFWGNNFIETILTYNTINLFKVYNSIAISIFT